MHYYAFMKMTILDRVEEMKTEFEKTTGSKPETLYLPKDQEAEFLKDVQAHVTQDPHGDVHSLSEYLGLALIEVPNNQELRVG